MEKEVIGEIDQNRKRVNNLEREIIFYFGKGEKISASTNKTIEEIAKILENYNYFINVDNKRVVYCINLKKVKFIELKESDDK